MGGVEGYLDGLSEILSPSADLFALCALEEFCSRLQRRGVHVIRIPLFHRVRIVRFLVALVVLTAAVIRYRIDVVQINGFLECILLVPARLLNCQTVYTRHGPFETELFKWYKRPHKFIPRFLARHIAHLSSRLVFVSETAGAVYKSAFPAGRVSVIPNWVREVPGFRARLGQAHTRIRIIYVGRLEQYKGLHLLLEALRGIDNVSLTVVGEGSYRKTLQTLAETLDVTFVGFIRDPSRYYEDADIFVMPSLGPEGLPLVSLEAMSHSLPCLLSDLPVHREITDDGRAALLFRAGDVADLREKLMSLIGSASRRAAYSGKAHKEITLKYHSTVARQAYLKVFGVEG